MTRTIQAGSSAASSVRGDIEGLRAIAVVMVLLFHANVPGVGGGFAGVDVFFVISGFLITSLLLREVQRTDSLSITAFYARRARRLLPAATLVLLFTGVVGAVLLPAGPRGQLGSDILASTFYVVNWSLAAQSVDYLAEDAGTSAVQHYWSLSVEEQFYVVWPLIILAVAWAATRTGRPAFRWMAGVLAAVTAASLAWSVVDTALSPQTAYFVSTTRVWELGFGALVAFAVPRLRGLKSGAAEVLALAGVAAIVVTAGAMSTSTAWPGIAALLPVAGTAAVIAAGCSRRGTLTAAVLGVAPLRFLGRISYSLYLWHWPLLVFLDEVRPGTGLRGRVVVLAAAVLLAYLSTVFVEDPIRFSAPLARSRARALAMGAVAMTASASLAAAILVTTPVLRSDLPTWARGASALMLDRDARQPEQRPDPATAVTSQGRVYPEPELAPEDVPALYDDGCQGSIDSAEVVSCDYGDAGSTKVVAVVGDSKVAQWLPALDRVGKQEGWLVRTYTKSACAFTDAELSIEQEPYDTCTQWNGEVIAELTGPDRPWLVVTSGGRDVALVGGTSEDATALVEGYSSWWRRLEKAGVGVVALADNVHPGTEVYTCVAEHPGDFTACEFPSGRGRGTSALQRAVDSVPGARFVDLTSWLCPTPECPAVIGNVLVYRQGSHITASYIETLTPVVRAALTGAAASATASAGR